MKELAHGNILSEPTPAGYRWTLSPRLNHPNPVIGELHNEGSQWILHFAPRFKVPHKEFASLQEAERWIQSVWENNGGLL